MSLRPLIGLCADTRPGEEAPAHSVDEPYLLAVARFCSATPVMIPAIVDALDVGALLERLDGLMLTGSESNVHPYQYGRPVSADHEPFDRARDSLSLRLIREAVSRGMPVLGICRGHQELNVALGGTLEAEIQRRAGRLDHRMPRVANVPARYAGAHAIELREGGLLESLLGKRSAQVNSLHRQAIDTLGPGVDVEAWAPDGVIEAISVPAARGFVLGVQWHPEFHAATNPDSIRLFEAFGRAAAVFASGRTVARARLRGS